MDIQIYEKLLNSLIMLSSQALKSDNLISETEDIFRAAYHSIRNYLPGIMEYIEEDVLTNPRKELYNILKERIYNEIEMENKTDREKALEEKIKRLQAEINSMTNTRGT